MAEIDVLDAKRYRRRWKRHDQYIVVCDGPDGKPYAVQMSASDEVWNRDEHLQSTTDWAFRAATLILRAYGAEKTIAELRNCALGEKTIPAIIANVLEEHVGGKNE